MFSLCLICCLRARRPQMVPKMPKLLPSNEDTVAIFGGEGCRNGREEVIKLAKKIKAPIGYSFRGKQWLEYDNPYAVGMTGLLGYGGAYNSINQAEVFTLSFIKQALNGKMDNVIETIDHNVGLL